MDREGVVRLTFKNGIFRFALPFFLAAPCWASGPATVNVVIQDYRFEPSEIKIAVGDTVRWINQEKRTSHSVVLPASLGGESERFFPNETWEYRFDAAGTYPYQCGPHPEMRGTIIVVPAL